MYNKIIEENFNLKKEDKKNYKNSVIERVGLANEFTIEEVENQLRDVEKLEKELISQISLSNAAKENVERNHKFVSKMSPEQLNAAAYLSETLEIIEKSERQLKQIKKMKKDYNQVMKIVLEKFGFVESNIMKDGSESK